MSKSLFTVFIAFGIWFGSINEAHAQNFGVGGGPSMMILGGDAGSYGTSIGIGARGRYNTDDVWGFVIGLYYHFPNTATNDITLMPVNNTDKPATFDYESRVSIFRAYFQLHYYIVNNGDEDFGLYEINGLGLFNENIKHQVIGCDETKYSCSSYNITQKYSDLAISLGLGFNVPLETFHIYAEGLYNLPTGEIFSDKITINASFEVNLGVIFILGE